MHCRQFHTKKEAVTYPFAYIHLDNGCSCEGGIVGGISIPDVRDAFSSLMVKYNFTTNTGSLERKSVGCNEKISPTQMKVMLIGLETFLIWCQLKFCSSKNVYIF